MADVLLPASMVPLDSRFGTGKVGEKKEMFNNLVECAFDMRRDAREAALFGATAVINIFLLLIVFVWSLYGFDLAAFGQNNDLAVNALVAPVSVPKALPDPVSAVKPNQKSRKSSRNFESFQHSAKSIDRECKLPEFISTVKTDTETVQYVPYIIDEVAKKTSTESYPTRRTDAHTSSAVERYRNQNDEPEIIAPPPSKSLPEVKKVTNVSKGVVNGLATNLPKPSYPVAAKLARISGTVTVQVTIDEYGKVIAANAADGHPLLRASAVQAARQAKFTPTKLSDQPVKVTGVIVYNFVPQ